MGPAPKLKFTEQEYLDRERVAQSKSEYYTVEIFAMVEKWKNFVS